MRRLKKKSLAPDQTPPTEQDLSPSVSPSIATTGVGTVADLIRDLAGEEAVQFPSLEPSLLESELKPERKSALEAAPTVSAIHSQPIVPPPLQPVPDERTEGWFLGLDIGTTGISAVLLNPTTEQLYPIAWSVLSSPTDHNIDRNIDHNPTPQTEQNPQEKTRRFRLPAVITLTPELNSPKLNSPELESSGLSTPESESDPNTLTQARSPFHPSLNRFSLPFSLTTPQVEPSSEFTDSTAAKITHPIVQQLKPCLKLGIPYWSAQTNQWQPCLQWSEHQTLSLHDLQHALQLLLQTLTQPTLTSIGVLSSSGLGLEEQMLQNALHQLAGVVVGYPSNWTDTYSFNIREAILQAGLVAHPEQICFLEDTVATLISVLERQTEPQAEKAQPIANPGGIILQNADWQGQTLILTAGATMTELTLVDLPDDLDTLTAADFQHRSLAFAGNAIDQDIVCQLLYPLVCQTVPVNPRQFESLRQDTDQRIDLSLEAIDPMSIQLDSLALPTPGEPDLPQRYRLHQRLESSPSGQILLTAARHLKIAFQQQSYFTVQFGDRIWTLFRRDLGSKVLLPYVQRLNRELNALLKQAEVSASEVDQVICTGGTAAMGTIARWLRQKLPNATIVQDTYAHPSIPQENCIFSCSRVAYGLAVLPLYPQLLNTARHQYSDYFLLMELLRHFPRRPITAKKMMQLLEQNGIDTTSCQSHILALLEGHLPPGFIPGDRDAPFFTKASLQNPDVYNVQLAPLFQKRGDHYHPNHHQHKQLQQYMSAILSNTQQTLEQPYSVTLDLSVLDANS
jgi:hypothetical protein